MHLRSMADRMEHHHASKNSQSLLESTGNWLVSGEKENRQCKILFHPTRQETESPFPVCRRSIEDNSRTLREKPQFGQPKDTETCFTD